MFEELTGTIQLLELGGVGWEFANGMRLLVLRTYISNKVGGLDCSKPHIGCKSLYGLERIAMVFCRTFRCLRFSMDLYRNGERFIIRVICLFINEVEALLNFEIRQMLHTLFKHIQKIY